jgi:hypothetical protein
MFLLLVVQYDSDDNVDDKNEASYVGKVFKKLQNIELRVRVRGRYVCLGAGRS